MTTESEPVAVRDNPAASRYEAHVGDVLAAFSEYVLADTVIVFVYTEVLPQFAGRGMGGTLAGAALDDARQRGLAVIPQCPFIRGFIERHPQYQDLVPQE